MKLYIAEKPSLGRAIAQALPKPHKKNQGYISAANGDCVTWCVGHLLEQAEPHHYDAQYKKWALSHLPIIPQQWQLKPKSKTTAQLKVIKTLLKQADEIVNAGDPDREGQLLVDEVISHLKTPIAKIKQAKRLLINDLNLSAVEKAIGNLQSNQLFVPLSTSALARSRADWLYGMNMTRAYTLQGQTVGYSGLLSVGRVQTPVLGLVVRRDEEIENFRSKPFYEVLANLTTLESPKNAFKAKWQPSEACQPYLDEENRLVVKGLAENVIQRIENKPGEVTRIKKHNKKHYAPLPHSLSSLQIDANKRFGISAKQCLDSCQSLYEKYKLITYPRSDSRYLPSEHRTQASDIIRAIANNNSELNEACAGTDLSINSKAWNDNKVEAHHAIIPTLANKKSESLSKMEQQVYQLICLQYLMQFYPPFQFSETQLEVRIEKGIFSTTAKQTIHSGWKALNTKNVRKSPTKENVNQNEPHRQELGHRELEQQELEQQPLPILIKGQKLLCTSGTLVEKNTQPPKPFNDATLLGAMTGISRYVKDPKIKKILKDTDGLGTEATRAGIIELLVKRQFLRRQGKNIISSEAGQGLIRSLPESASIPDMTALWEAELDKISNKQLNYKQFITPLEQQIEYLIEQAKSTKPEKMRNVESPKQNFKRRFKKTKTAKKSG
ncbi:MAG: DNA topoisomerase-3 [Oceanicoccus sp.]|jgi:DNA topoisomerase-3